MDERFREKSYPFASHLGMELVDWSEGYARIEMALQPFHDNRHGSRKKQRLKNKGGSQHQQSIVDEYAQR